MSGNVPGPRTPARINAALRAACVLAIILPASSRTAAQSEAAVDRENPAQPDSARVSVLEEQLIVPEGEEDLEREGPTPPSGRSSSGWRASLKVRGGAVLQQAAAYSRGTFAGDRLKLFQKLAVRHGDRFAAEVLTDKDPGERAAADFVSGTVTAGLFGGSVRIVAGDFRMRAAQGLLFGSGRSFGKGAAVIEPAIREAWGLMEGTSADEARYFRGGAIQARAGPVSAFLFGSDRKGTPLLSPGGDLRGVDGSGYHRTPSEIARKGALTERSAGAGLRIAFGELLSVGGGFLATALRTAADGGAEGAVRGVSMRRGSVDLRANVGGFSAFGEALPSGAQTPWIAGALLADAAGRRIIIVRRFYPPADDFHGTSGFADAPGGTNEEGTYVGVEASILPGLVVSAYIDLYSKMRPVQGSIQPPSGVDRLVRLSAAPTKSLSAEVRVRSRRSEAGVSDVAAGPLPVPGNRIEEEIRPRGEVRWVPGERVACGLRLEYCAVTRGGGPGETGVMATAELSADPWRGMSIDCRVRFFRSDSYASGIPSVDVDIPGTISSTVYAGEGSAWSAGWGWRCSRHLRISLRYSVLRRDDLRRIGTGPGELPSNIREKAGFQLDLSL